MRPLFLITLFLVLIWDYCKIIDISAAVFIDYKNSIIINLKCHCIPNICSFNKVIFSIVIKPCYLLYNFFLDILYIKLIKNLFFSIPSRL